MPKQPTNVVPFKASWSRRVEVQIDKIFEDLENLPIPVKERVAALYTIARLQVLLAKGGRDDGAGSAVRRYATAFTRKDGGGRGSRGARPTVVEAPDDLGDDDDDDSAA